MGVPGLQEGWAVTHIWPAHLGKWALMCQPGDVVSSILGNAGSEGTWEGAGYEMGLPGCEQGKRSLLEMVLWKWRHSCCGWGGSCVQGIIGRWELWL